jgi:hypothetical protein
MRKKSNYEPHFRRGKSANKGHPAYIYAKVGDKFKFIGITHAKITHGTKNIPLEQNPDPTDSRTSYIRPNPQKEKPENFGKRLPHWRFAERDKGKVKGVIKKDKYKE